MLTDQLIFSSYAQELNAKCHKLNVKFVASEVRGLVGMYFGVNAFMIIDSIARGSFY